MLTIKIKVSFAIAAILFLCIAATHRPEGIYKNLKILPKDIEPQQMDSLMSSYNAALGVDCSFCHAPFDKKIPDSLNFASDALHMKAEARKMMRLTIGINQKYFNHNKKIHPVYLNVVNCNTCHRGSPVPDCSID